jgi:heterodisulfide reductase subunit B
MAYALFPGCIARNMYPSIEKSTQMVFKELGLELVEVKFTCCPAPGVIRSYDFDSWLVIANGCYGTLEAAHRHLSNHPESVAMVNEKLATIGMSFKGTSKVVHFVDVLDQMLPQITSRIKVELGLKVAIHYGCHYLKPSCDSGRNVESPEVLERIVKALGCESVDFPEKLSCCGAGGGVWSGDEKVSLGILDRKMRFIKESGADCVLDICPFCHLQLDQGQKRLKSRYDVPVLHLNQLIGLSFGFKDKVLGVHTHMVATRDIAKKAKRARKDLKAEV